MSKKKSRRRRAAAGPAPGAITVPARSGASSSDLPDEEYRRLFRICGWFVLAAAALFAAALSILSWMRYRNFWDGRFDLGNMVQAVYNTAHGRCLEMTDPYSAVPVSRLGSHVDPILALFAPLWWVWHSPVMLLVAQATIVAASAWPAYRLGARLFKDPRPAALLAGALLLYPPLQFTVLSEFHPVTLAIPLLLFAFLYLEEGRLVRALPFLVLAALCKEEIPLMIALMAGYFALRKRSWRPLLIAVVAVAYFAVAVGVVMPHYHKGGPPALLARYAEYGTGTGEIMKNVVRHPGHTLHDLVTADNLHYWRELLWPVSYTPLISPLTTLISAPELLINGLSSRGQQRIVTYHYSAGIIPFIFAAVVLAIVRLRAWVTWLAGRPWLARRRWAVTGARWLGYDTFALALFALCAYSVYVMGPLPLPFPGGRLHKHDLRVHGACQGLAAGRRHDPRERHRQRKQQRRRATLGATHDLHVSRNQQRAVHLRRHHPPLRLRRDRSDRSHVLHRPRRADQGHDAEAGLRAGRCVRLRGDAAARQVGPRRRRPK